MLALGHTALPHGTKRHHLSGPLGFFVIAAQMPTRDRLVRDRRARCALEAPRRSVGLDTTPLTPAAIAAFIRDGQHIKPGNLMPPFRIFSPDELEALSSYLAGLK